MVDFGADESFMSASEKLKEHYGIDISASAVRTVTLTHARAITDQSAQSLPSATVTPAATVIAETDGCLLPMVTVAPSSDELPQDARRRRQVHWQEARLSLAHQAGSTEPVFAATLLGDVDTVGDQLYHCAQRVGLKSDSHVHSVGDGAPWIADQVDRVFGSQATYLVDFYHLSEYLAAAAKPCAGNDHNAWLAEQQQRMKTDQCEQVLQALAPFIEPAEVPNEQAPVRACDRYLRNRPQQLAYQQALAAELPIGSGEIESAHRYVIQARLKLPGAWWVAANADNMLGLRTLRANNDWQQYWDQLQQPVAA